MHESYSTPFDEGKRMKLGIMQPYFFPYIGYWQLLNAVDVYVIYDDVNYIKQGWINRNFILGNDDKLRITLELQKASPFKAINEIEIGANGEKILKTVGQYYSRAPYFQDVFPLLTGLFRSGENNLAQFLTRTIRGVAEYLSITTRILVSSQLDKDTALKGEDKIIDMCKRLGAEHYINPIGGVSLYDRDKFGMHGLALSFLKTLPLEYRQFGSGFVPDLSIIDVLMFNSRESLSVLLGKYELI